MMNTLRSQRTVRLRTLAVTPLLAAVLALTAGAASNAHASNGGAGKPGITTTTNSSATAADPNAEYGPCAGGDDDAVEVTTSDATPGEVADALCKK